MSTPRRQQQAAAELRKVGEANPLRALTMAELNERLVDAYEKLEAIGNENQDIRQKFDADMKDMQERANMINTTLAELKKEKEIRKRSAAPVEAV